MGGACNRTCHGVSAGKRVLFGFPSSLWWLALWLPRPGLQVLETAATPGGKCLSVGCLERLWLSLSVDSREGQKGFAQEKS